MWNTKNWKNCDKICITAANVKFKPNKKRKMQGRNWHLLRKLMETEEACKSEREERNEADKLLKETQTKITELRNITGTLKLHLKCALNEKELCECKIVEERNKTCTHVSVQYSA